MRRLTDRCSAAGRRERPVDQRHLALELELAEVEAGPLLQTLSLEDFVHDRAGTTVGRDTRLVDGEEYSVIRVGREIVHFEEPYTVPDERRADDALRVGETRVEEGAPGVMSVSAEVTRRSNRSPARWP